MNCQRCSKPISTTAPFCPVCGADPVIGADWLTTSALLVDANGEVALPHRRPHDATSMFELVTELLYHATGIAAAEAMAAEAVVCRRQASESGAAGGDVADGRLDDTFERATEAAYARLAACRLGFLAVADPISDRLSVGNPPFDEFEREYSPAVWAFTEYAAYLDLMSQPHLRDVFQRRTFVLLSRRGFTDETTFAAGDGSFALTYDRLALVPVPAGDGIARRWLTERHRGPEGSFGELALALVPSAWRSWFDQDLAPWAGLVVFVKPDPLAGIACDDPDWEGERAGACAHYAAWLNEPGEKVEDVRPATICGLPAVRCQLTQVDDDGAGYLVDHAWVKGPRHLYYVFTWARDQRHELVQAVHGAFAGFAPAGCAAARDAAPGSTGPADASVTGSAATPADVRGERAAEER